MADTLTLERDLAATLQLPRRELCRHREMLVPDLEWVTEGRTICYTEDGVTKMLGLLGLVDSVELPSEPEKMVAVVVNPDIRNPRLVLAEREGREVLVRVDIQGDGSPPALLPPLRPPKPSGEGK